MREIHRIRATPAHVRAAFGYACTCAWGVLLLLEPIFGSSAQGASTAVASMLPGLVTCLAVILRHDHVVPLHRRSPLVCLSAVTMTAGTLLCTLPATAAWLPTRLVGLSLSGLFGVVMVMAWFQVFARMHPRAIIVVAGCSITVAAAFCWVVLFVGDLAAAVLASLMPLGAFLLLPSSPAEEAVAADVDGALDLASRVMTARTWVGLAVTFFVVSGIEAAAPRFGLFSEGVSPLSLLVAVGMSVFFVASAHVVRRRIDPSILYKILLTAFAAVVFLLAYSMGVSASLLLYANVIADVMMWTVLALFSKRVAVAPYLVFAVGWLAECLGNVAGQLAGGALAGHPLAFFVLTIVLILLAVGFAFSEGKLVLEVEPGEEGDGQEDEHEPDPPEGTGPQPAVAGEGRMQAFCDRHGLSPREREVFALWVTGHGQRHIEETLFISEATVKSHLRSIYRKCEVHNRAQIIALYEQEQVVAVPDQAK